MTTASTFSGTPAAAQELRFASRNPVEPLAGTWEVIASPDADAFQVPPPPPNQSPATAAELAELRVLARARTPQDLLQILRWSEYETSVAANWEILANQLIRRYGLGPPAASRVHYLLTTAMHTALIAGWNAKYRYLRPRPSTLDPGVQATVIAVPEHPAYPSGHSIAAGAASTILARLFPTEAAVAEALAQDSGLSRLKAGIHYRSDHTAGVRLGRQVAEAVLQNAASRDRGPSHYLPTPGQQRLSFPELLTIVDCQNVRCHR